MSHFPYVVVLLVVGFRSSICGARAGSPPIECFCNGPECNDTARCTSQAGACFLRNGVEQGCAEGLREGTESLTCATSVRSYEFKIIGETTLICCTRENLCNRVKTSVLDDSTVSRTPPAGTANHPSGGDNHLDPERQGTDQQDGLGEDGFRATLIVVPLLGAVALACLMAVAIRMLRKDMRTDKSKQLSAAKTRNYIRKHFLAPLQRQPYEPSSSTGADEESDVGGDNPRGAPHAESSQRRPSGDVSCEEGVESAATCRCYDTAPRPDAHFDSEVCDSSAYRCGSVFMRPNYVVPGEAGGSPTDTRWHGSCRCGNSHRQDAAPGDCPNRSVSVGVAEVNSSDEIPSRGGSELQCCHSLDERRMSLSDEQRSLLGSSAEINDIMHSRAPGVHQC